MKNKELTKQKLIDAVGTVLREEDYSRSGVNKVARSAGVSKNLIYRYFNSFERLVEAYVLETDYWMKFGEQINQVQPPADLKGLKALLVRVLSNQFLFFKSDRKMQQLILWELSHRSNLMQSIHRMREALGQHFLNMTDRYLIDKPINFRAVAALLVGVRYFMLLHTRHNGGMFVDVDLDTEAGQHKILLP